MQYWLMKSEPGTYSIEDLQGMPGQSDHWDGVRNYQARNMMRDQMKVGDRAFFYHSNTKDPGIVGIVEVVREGYPDHTALDPESDYYDPKSSAEDPRWYMVDVRYIRHLRHPIGLADLKQHQFLHDMPLLRRGNRLSIMPVSEEEWHYILKLEKT